MMHAPAPTNSTLAYSNGETGTGYRAGRSGVQGHPIGSNHARRHLACINVFIFYGRSTWSDRPGIGREMIISYNTNNQWSGSERGREGWACLRRAPGWGRSGEVCHGRYGDSRTWGAERERSTSTHAMRLQFGERCTQVPICK
eukprot:1844695-Pleurochrysis_carterae.AAC.1